MVPPVVRTWTVRTSLVCYIHRTRANILKRFLLLTSVAAAGWAQLPSLPMFAKRYHVFAPDQIGFGSSDKPFLNYRVQTMVKFLDGFYRKLNIERATLVGNSLGGWIAAAFALAHPDKVDRAVLNLILYNQAMVTDAFAEQAFAGHMRNNDGYTINAFIDSIQRNEDMLDGKLGSIDKCGHIPPVECSLGFNEAVLAWLEK